MKKENTAWAPSSSEVAFYKKDQESLVQRDWMRLFFGEIFLNGEWCLLHACTIGLLHSAANDHLVIRESLSPYTSRLCLCNGENAKGIRYDKRS